MEGHDLVVGGTGMLAGLSEALAREGRRVTVLARDHLRLDRLARRAPGVRPLSVNYEDGPALEAALEKAARQSGPIERAVCWIHATAPEAPLAVARHVRHVYCHLLGSAVADPSVGRLGRWRARFAGLPGLDYRIVVLGFVLKPDGGSRWLTHDEISAGAKAALDASRPVSVLGVVEPWSRRP